MKKKFKVIALVMIVAVAAAITVYAAGGYDSENDPLVSLSYITKVLKPQLDTEIAALKAEIAELKNGTVTPGTSSPATSGTGTADAPSYTYEVIKMTKGQKLMATTACDIVLRSGNAKVISPFTEGIVQGLNDYTDGTELLNGDKVPMNHFILIPRGNDGRGIEITTDADTYVIVRGGYEIVNAQ